MGRWVAWMLAIAALSTPAVADYCLPVAACDAFWEVDAVFVARARVAWLDATTQRTRLEIEERFRGDIGESIEVVSWRVGQEGGDFGFRDDVGYVVFARRRPDGAWHVERCGGTELLQLRSQDLPELGALAGDPPPASRVGGWVSMRVTVGGQPVAPGSVPAGSLLTGAVGAVVVLEGPAGRRVATADEGGSFEFRDVAPGSYRLSVAASDEYAPLGEPVEVVVPGPGRCPGRRLEVTSRPSHD